MPRLWECKCIFSRSVKWKQFPCTSSLISSKDVQAFYVMKIFSKSNTNLSILATVIQSRGRVSEFHEGRICYWVCFKVHKIRKLQRITDRLRPISAVIHSISTIKIVFFVFRHNFKGNGKKTRDGKQTF